MPEKFTLDQESSRGFKCGCLATHPISIAGTARFSVNIGQFTSRETLVHTKLGKALEEMQAQPELEYVGFWVRVWAAIIDSALITVIIFPLLISIYGWAYLDPENLVRGSMDFLISWVLPAIAVISLWIYKLATPGKMAIGAKIVDARTGRKPSKGQLIGRYFAYFVSILPLFLGLLWVAFDKRKQGWHDKLAGTVVVRPKRGNSEPVRFEKQDLVRTQKLHSDSE